MGFKFCQGRFRYEAVYIPLTGLNPVLALLLEIKIRGQVSFYRQILFSVAEP